MTAEPRPTVIFLHLPKAGGSTMNHVIDWNYNHVYSISRHARIPELIALPDEEKRQIDCLKGQIFYGIHQYLPQPCTYISIMREPVDRVISQYYYDFDRKRRLGEPVPDWTMEEYLEHVPFHPTYQLRLLVGGNTIDQILHDPLPPDAVEIAKRHIEQHFTVAGVLDFYDETLLLMKHTLGWTRAFYARQNTGKERRNRAPLPEHTIRRLEKECALERELYDFMRQHAQAQIKQQGQQFWIELEQLQRMNQRFGRLWNAAQPLHGTPFWRLMRRTARRLNRGLRAN